MRRLFLIMLLPSLLAATEFREVYSSNYPDGAPSWGPGGAEIAFTSTKSGDWEVWIVDAWGGDPVNFSQYPDTTDIYANWSADGARILYSSTRNNGHGLNDYDIWMQDLETRQLICLTNYDGYDNWAAFDPTGTQIAFTSDRGGDKQIWLMPVDLSSPAVQVSSDAAECHHPCWSPDGAYVAYDAIPEGGGDRSIFRVPVGGGAAVAIPSGLMISNDPHWSPDGRYIAFCGGDDLIDWDLYLWDLQEEALIQLTDSRYPEQSPVWNEAGDEIAYAAVINENKDLWVAYDLPVGTAARRASWGDLKRLYGR